jgi:hypothetical protein
VGASKSHSPVKAKALIFYMYMLFVINEELLERKVAAPV